MAFSLPAMPSDGFVQAGLLADALRLGMTEGASASGLSRDAAFKSARLRAPAPQARLRDIVECLHLVRPWCGSLPQAFAWDRAQPLPSFGDQAADALVMAWTRTRRHCRA